MTSDSLPVKRLTVSPTECAFMLSIDRDTVDALIRRGELEASKISPRCIRIRVAAIDDLLARKRIA